MPRVKVATIPAMIDRYKTAFTRCYPEKEIKVKPKLIKRELRFAVVINQDKGDRLLTEDELREATMLFNAGRTA